MAFAPVSNNGVYKSGEVLRQALKEYIPEYDTGRKTQDDQPILKSLRWRYGRQGAVLSYPTAVIDRINQTPDDLGIREIEDGKEVLYRSYRVVFQVSCIASPAKARVRESFFIPQSILGAVSASFLSSDVRALVRKYSDKLGVACDLLSAGGVRAQFEDEASDVVVPASCDVVMSVRDEVRQPDPFPCIVKESFNLEHDAPKVTLKIPGEQQEVSNG